MNFENISIESEMSTLKKITIENVCVSTDDLHEMECVQCTL